MNKVAPMAILQPVATVVWARVESFDANPGYRETDQYLSKSFGKAGRLRTARVVHSCTRAPTQHGQGLRPTDAMGRWRWHVAILPSLLDPWLTSGTGAV